MVERAKDPKTGKFISRDEAKRRGIEIPKLMRFDESFEAYVKKTAKDENLSEQEVVENILSREFAIVEFDESTGNASLKLYQEGTDISVEKMDDKKLHETYKDLRENFAPVSAGIEYHKAFLCGSGFNTIVDDPSDKHKLAMRDEINEMVSKIYFDYYRKGLDRILWILSDDLLTQGVIASEIIYGEEIDFEDFAEKKEDGTWDVRLVQQIKTSEWKKLKGIMRLKIIDDAISRLTPHRNSDSLEFLYWGLDETVPDKVSPSVKKRIDGNYKKKEEETGTKLLPWQIFWLSWNTRGTNLKGESIIRPVLELALQVRKILKAVGVGFERWADRRYFFVCGSEKRPWNKQAIHNFIQYLKLMVQNKWTGMPVPQGFDVKEIGGQVFEGTNILNYLVGLICSGMNYPRDFLEYGRTRAGDKAWLAWQVKYGSNQRQLRRDIEHQLFQKHLWCKFGKTYKVPKQGVSEADRETAEIYIPKIIWRAEGRWQQAEEIKTLQGWLNVANPIGPEFKLAIEKRGAEVMGFGEIEFPSFQDVRREMKRFQKQQQLDLEAKEERLAKRQTGGVSKKISPTGAEKEAPPPAGGTRIPKTVKKSRFGESVEEDGSRIMIKEVSTHVPITIVSQSPTPKIETALDRLLDKRTKLMEQHKNLIIEKAKVERDKTLKEKERVEKEIEVIELKIKEITTSIEETKKTEEAKRKVINKIDEQVEEERKMTEGIDDENQENI